jgi:hypothetical protein
MEVHAEEEQATTGVWWGNNRVRVQAHLKRRIVGTGMMTSSIPVAIDE